MSAFASFVLPRYALSRHEICSAACTSPNFFYSKKGSLYSREKKYQSILGIIVDHLFEVMIEKKG